MNFRFGLWLGVAVVSASASAQWLGSSSEPLTRKVRGPGLERVLRPSTPTGELLVMLRPGQNAAWVAARYGLVFQGSLAGQPQVAVMRARSGAAVLGSARALASDRAVLGVTQVERRPLERHAFTPNDPFFPNNTPSAGWPGQWYLKNGLVPGLDAGVDGAWLRDLTGQGVRVGIVDDGIQANHPDLTANYVGSTSYDFGQNDSDPSPVFVDDSHGTAVSGIVGARGGNGVGITGVAPFVSLSMLRLDFNGSSNAQVVNAILASSNPNGTVLSVKNHSYGWGFLFEPVADIVTALNDSSAAPMIHVRSAGNAREGVGEDSNKYAERNGPNVITVAALGSDGLFAEYSSFGANVMVTAPSSSGAGTLPFLSTDRTGSDGYSDGSDPFANGNYTYQFGGTSAAAPVVTGVMALAKQANPALTTRMAKHLLARTSDVVHPGDNSVSSAGGWRTNGAGLKYNPNYGFGVVDADELTQLATQWVGVSPLQTWSSGTQSFFENLPDNNATGKSRTFQVPAGKPLEEVLVRITATHDYRGDLEIWLTSPSGMTSRLCSPSIGDNDFDLDWTFISHAFWGENPQGTWTLRVADRFSQDFGAWTGYAVTMRQGEPLLPETAISGTVDLLSYEPEEQGTEVTVELFAPGGETPVESKVVSLGAGGSLSLSTLRTGAHDIAVKGPHWLRKRINGLNLTGSPISGLNFALINGDVNGDNEVNLDDYFDLADAYRTEAGDAGWNPNADLDGTGFVDLDDYFVLADAFRLVGD